MAITIGLAYLWFGLLKFFPGASPAEVLAKQTIEALTFGVLPAEVALFLLAAWETAVKFALVHMLFTFTPLFLFPDLAFSEPPFYFSLVGQYIFKNLILVAALIYLLKTPALATVVEEE